MSGEKRMKREQQVSSKKGSMLAAGFALTVYIVGGLSVMVGLGFIGMLGSQDLWGWGEASSIGYLLFAVGIILSILGVLVMRIMRNRRWA
jgi:hypothetical protein